MNELIGMAKAPKGHQRLILDLCCYINDNANTFFSNTYLALPESNINDTDPNSLQPDVLVVDLKNEVYLVAIEIEQKQNIKYALKKCSYYIEKEDVEECFLFVYQPIYFCKYRVTKVFRIDKLGIIQDTKSRVLDIDFYRFID